MLDDRTRPLHRAWHGTILNVDDPWWETHFPPNGWNCRCTVLQLSDRDLERHGWKPSARPAAGTPRTFLGRGMAKAIQVPEGIDPGFAYNPGRDYWRGLSKPISDAEPSLPAIDIPAGGLPELPTPRRGSPLLPAHDPADPQAEEEALHNWDLAVARHNTEAPVIVDPTGMPFVADHSAWLDAAGRSKVLKMDRERFLNLIADTLASPDEVWLWWDEPRKEGDGAPDAARLKRTLVARWVVDGEEFPIFIGAFIGPDGWSVVTQFKAGSDRYYAKQRRGTLVYRRGG